MNTLIGLGLALCIFMVALHLWWREPKLPADFKGPLPPLPVIEAHIAGLEDRRDDIERDLDRWRAMRDAHPES